MIRLSALYDGRGWERPGTGERGWGWVGGGGGGVEGVAA